MVDHERQQSGAHAQAAHAPAGTQLRRACLAALLALAITALIETVRVPWLGQHRWLQVALGTYALSLLHVVKDLAASVLCLPLFGLMAEWQARGYPIARSVAPARWARAALAGSVKLVAVGAVLGAAYEKLVWYPDFGRYAPVTFAFVALFVALAVAVVPGAAVSNRARVGVLSTAQRWGVPIAALLGAGGCYAIDILSYKREYPTLHVSLLQVAHLLLALGLWQAAPLLRMARPRPRIRLIGWASVAALCVLANVAAASAMGERAYPYWSAHTTLGQSQAVFRAYEEPRRERPIALPEAARARALFRTHNGLPELPADFDLLRYNVLLLQSEATRLDQTSLMPGGPATTPELRKLHERGAFNFTGAHSPASGTFQSTAGLHGMSYPSSLALEIWSKPWQGHYRDPQPLPAELFAQAGYDTFWVGHDKARSFTEGALGFERGFRTRALLSNERSHAARADEQIAAAAIEQLRAAKQSGRRFFGWAFFVSPHNEYATHYRDWPAATPLDQYRQEIRFLDEQIARVLRELEALDLLASTIVLYTADHGEEFGDHGGYWHSSSTYTELTNVPLLVWLPGMQGRTLTAPTSTMYLFPWLLAHGSPAMRAASLHRLRHQIGPMLERTGGAVVTELLVPHRMAVSLVYADRKFNYELNSRLHEAFRVDRDRLEQRDLFELDPALTYEAERRVAAYLEVRAGLRSFQLRPDRADPRR